MKYLSITTKDERNDFWLYPICFSICIPWRASQLNPRHKGTFWIYMVLFGYELKIWVRYKNFNNN